MVQKRGTKAINKLCVREILSLSFVCGAYFFEFRGRNLVCFVITYNFHGKYAPEAGKTRMHTAFFTRATSSEEINNYAACLDQQQNKYCGLKQFQDHAGIVCFKPTLNEITFFCVLKTERESIVLTQLLVSWGVGLVCLKKNRK